MAGCHWLWVNRNLAYTNFKSSRNQKLNSVGRPIPGIEIRIDPSTARGKENVRLGRNKVYSAGEVLVRGSGIFTGYHNTINEKSSKSIFVDGWFRTGDLGYCDEEGYLYILGRV